MDHSFDGIEEYDNPLPKWWFNMFMATIVFSLIYLVLYPGLGNFKGLLGWTSVGHWEQEVKEADEKYSPIFKALAAKPVVELAKDKSAMKIGQRLYANNCAVCHGSTGRGALGFPNLTDNDWLYGGDPAKIKETLIHGRAAVMPVKGLNPAMTNSDVSDLTHYLLSFSGRSDDKLAIKKGGKMFQTACAACHGADAKGNQSVGAPNLTDNIWLYGGTTSKITQTLLYGRAGVMPAQKDKLDEDKIHLLTAYIYSLSNKE
jgi:cytochrome c oxidase cbb3-type subunit 3